MRLFRFGLRRGTDSVGTLDPPADWIVSGGVSTGFVRLVGDDDVPSDPSPSEQEGRSPLLETAAEDNGADHVIDLRSKVGATSEQPAGPSSGSLSPAAFAGAVTPTRETDHMLPTLRFERAVFALAHRTEILADRFERMERRLDNIVDQLFEGATQMDLLDLEARRARLAAEVARMHVELRAELDQRLSKLSKDMTLLATPAEQKPRRDVPSATFVRTPTASVPVAPAPPLHLSGDSHSLGALSVLDTLPGDMLDRPGPFSL